MKSVNLQAMQIFTSKQTMQEKGTTTDYATIGKLTRFYFTGRGLHNRHTHNPQ